MGAALPEGLAAALQSDPAEFPHAAELSDLTNRLAPLLETATATAAAAIPVGLMAPKAPLSLAGTLKLLALKWGHTVILPMAIGAASGGVVWEAREYAASRDDKSMVARAAETRTTVALSQGQHSKREFVVSNAEVDETPEPGAAEVEPAAPPARAGSALGPARVASPPLPVEDPPVVAVAEDVAEIELIDRAQRALLRQPAVARQWVEEHMRRFPDGTFVQERETVAIEALVREGRLVEARARAFQFRTRFPQSAYLRRIDAVLRSPKTP
jgi:hypothetical protein